MLNDDPPWLTGSLSNAAGAAIYVRSDDPLQRQQQLTHCQAYARQHGLAVDESHIYFEETTASDEWFDRPVFASMYRGVYGGSFSALIVTNSDVLMRQPDDLSGFMRTITQFGIKLHIAT